MIIPDLYFDRKRLNDKLDLSKLGTDYIIVNEPIWPVDVKNVIDRTPLKHSYLWKN